MTTAVHIKQPVSDPEFEKLVRTAHDCLACGRCSGGCPMMELFPEYFNPRRLMENLENNGDGILNGTDIWLCAACYRCNSYCPQAIELPELFVKLRKKVIAEKGTTSLRKALRIIQGRIPFHRSFFRICMHPERLDIDNETMEKLLESGKGKHNRKIMTGSGKKIAIVGSGPAGLYAAYLLRKKGHEITIFESDKKAGGMLRRCIPEYRIPSSDIEKDIGYLLEMGIEFKTGMRIGKKTNIRNLKIKYDAVMLATGAHHITRLNIPGEDLPGIFGSLEFLEKLKKGDICKTCIRRGVVIGGGNTAMDVASVMKRSGVEEVLLLYRRTRNEMPADINEIAEVEKTGVEIRELTAPVKFRGGEYLEAIDCMKMELGSKDYTGRRRPVPKDGGDFTIDTDLVVNAIGEKPTVDFLPDMINLNPDGSVAADPITLETSMEGVFAGGDVALGSATVSEAIISAGKAALGIHKYLNRS